MKNRLFLFALLGVTGFLAYRYFFASSEAMETTENTSSESVFSSAWAWIENAFDFSYKTTAVKIIRQVQAENDSLSYIPESLVMAIIQVESGFNVSATGSSGEYGLMQIHPVTLRWLANKVGVTVYENYNPTDNIFFGLVYLDILFQKYGDWDAVIHSYNVGPGAYDNGNRNEVYHQKVLDALSAF